MQESHLIYYRSTTGTFFWIFSFFDSLECCFWISSIVSKRWPFNLIFICGNSPTSQGAKSIPHPPYSPDLAPYVLGLFSHMKWSLRAAVLRRYKRFKRNRKQHSRLSRNFIQKNFPAVENEVWLVHCSVILGLNFHLDVFYEGTRELFDRTSYV